MRYGTVLLALLFASSAWAGDASNIGSVTGVQTSGTYLSTAAAPCSPVCSNQQFDSDPFAADPNARFTKVNADPICPMYWNDGNGTLGRIRATSDCYGGGSYARFNGLISGDGCAAYQITAVDDGLGGANAAAWQPGFVIRDSSTSNSALPGLNSFPPDAIVVSLFQGISAGHVSTYAQNGQVSETCLTFGAVAVGDWIGACISGSGPATVVNVFNLGSTDPGDPDTIDGGLTNGTWGTAECQMTPCSSPSSCASPANIHWGIWMNNQDPMGTAANFQVDNFRTYSCQGG